ncbi:hypothetical protein ACN9MB_01255 [Dyella kyungheensis]|uniref:hypothetical protein n=1 Tax=Dyella kyungheensis TaxID=1242174 RepID=UPI003CEAA4AC
MGDQIRDTLWPHSQELIPAMAADWNNATLQMLDLKFAEANIRPHARPLRAAQEILGADFSMFAFGSPEVKAITDAYSALFPQVVSTWPGAGVGLVASGDDVRRVVLSVMFGRPKPIFLWQGLGFQAVDAWRTWCRNDPHIAASSSFAFADLWDFSYGLNALGAIDSSAAELWEGAGSNLADLGTSLPAATGVSSLLQPIHLVAELSLKAGLHCVGANPGRTHDLVGLASKLAQVKPHRDDALLALSVKHFPNYVESRYKMTGISRLGVVRRALAAQFIAGSSVRRVSSIDLALAMEKDSWPGARQPFLF